MDLHAEHRAELEALTLQRLPLAMGVILLVILGTLPVEVYFDPGHLVPFVAVYAVELFVTLAALIGVRWFPRHARTIATAWGSTLGICMASYYPLVNGDATLAMTALICLVATLPAMLPYEVWHQAFLGLACILGFLVALLFGIPMSLHWPHMLVAFAAVFVSSIVAARSLGRLRWAAFKREAILRHAHEKLRTALAQAESAVEMRSRLVANVSHELRTPINVIIGYTDMLLDAMGEPAIVSDTAPRIRAYAVSLDELVSDLLDLSRLTHKVEVSADDIELWSLLEDVALGVQRLVRDKPVAVLVECDPVRVRIDRMRLLQILNNLATNAAKFTAAGSIAIRARVDHEGLRFDVADTGCGIPAEQHELIFRAFEQLGPIDSRSEHGGIGLGLAIVRQLTDLLRGAITVTSVPGKGSTFTVTFPDVQATAIAPGAASGPARTAA